MIVVINGQVRLYDVSEQLECCLMKQNTMNLETQLNKLYIH